MQNKIYEAIKYWADIPTWHTGNPLDIKRFHAAMIKLYEEVGIDINKEDIQQVLKKYRQENPLLLGGKPSDKKVDEYVEKIVLSLKRLKKERYLN